MTANDRFIVYKITNIVNGKLYFGITKCSLNIRWNSHRHAALRKKKHTFLANAMFKYGVDNFKIELVKECGSEKEMYELEKILIQEFSTNNPKNGYNNSSGGEVSSKGMKHSDETKRRLSEVQKGKKRPPMSQETKDKIGFANKGKVNMAAVIKSANLRRGVKLSKETRHKLSLSLGGKGVIPVIKKDKNGNILSKYESVSDAAIKTGILQTAISNTLNNRAKTAGGFIWQYNVQN